MLPLNNLGNNPMTKRPQKEATQARESVNDIRLRSAEAKIRYTAKAAEYLIRTANSRRPKAS